jgi:hypothetical protein
MSARENCFEAEGLSAAFLVFVGEGLAVVVGVDPAAGVGSLAKILSRT